MRYAMGVTMVAMGGLLIYAGFTNLNVWNTALATIRGEKA